MVAVSLLSAPPTSTYSATTLQSPARDSEDSEDTGETTTPQEELARSDHTDPDGEDPLTSLTLPGVIQTHRRSPGRTASSTQVTETVPSWERSMMKYGEGVIEAPEETGGVGGGGSRARGLGLGDVVSVVVVVIVVVVVVVLVVVVGGVVALVVVEILAVLVDATALAFSSSSSSSSLSWSMTLRKAASETKWSLPLLSGSTVHTQNPVCFSAALSISTEQSVPSSDARRCPRRCRLSGENGARSRLRSGSRAG